MRLLFCAASAPACAALAVVSAMGFDLAVLGCSAHRCVHDHGLADPRLAVLALALSALGRLAWAATRAATGVVRAAMTRRRLDAASTWRSDGVRVMPVDDVQAFVLGFLHPHVYVSRGLLATDCVDSVLAHERAHQRRRDPLRRLAVSLGVALHLPGVARYLERQLGRMQESAADADAADSIGDAARIAAALVRFARLRVSRPAAALGWQGGDLEARVSALLADEPPPDRPTTLVLVAVIFAGACAALLAADRVHRGAELLLGWLD